MISEFHGSVRLMVQHLPAQGFSGQQSTSKAHQRPTHWQATALGGVAIALSLLVAPSPTAALPPTLLPAGLNTFSDWCNRRNTLPNSAQTTVDALLKVVKTTDCRLADQQLRGMTTISLPSSLISDLRPLVGFSQLKSLSLRGNALTDLSPLTQLQQLEVLDLTGKVAEENRTVPARRKEVHNKLLAQLPSWVPFDFGRPVPTNRITDLSPLTQLQNLRELHLGGNDIQDIRPLAALPNLRVLSLPENPLHNLDPLEQMRQLTALDVSSLPSRDLGPIVELRNLRTLKVANNGLKNLRLIRNMKQLEELDLDRNVLQEIDFLAEMRNLQKLSIDHNQITSLAPLAGLNQIQVLHVRDNQIRDFRVVAGMTQLKELLAWDNPVEIPACPYPDPFWAYKICKYRLSDVGA